MKRRGGEKRFCAQKAIVTVGGQGYCWYHNPENPHKFSEGYRFDEIRKELETEQKKAEN